MAQTIHLTYSAGVGSKLEALCGLEQAKADRKQHAFIRVSCVAHWEDLPNVCEACAKDAMEQVAHAGKVFDYSEPFR